MNKIVHTVKHAMDIVILPIYLTFSHPGLLHVHVCNVDCRAIECIVSMLNHSDCGL